MAHLSELIKKAEEQTENFLKKYNEKFPKIIGIGTAALYFYGMLVRSVSVGIRNVWQNNNEPLFTWSRLKT